MSGMHGDEAQSSPLLVRYLLMHEKELPPFLCIPVVSPTATAMGTRINGQGHDINRQFYTGTKDEEASTMMELIKPYKFRVVIDLHEDPDRTSSFYLYDSGRMTEGELSDYRSLVQQTPAKLYTGIDDVVDKELGCEIDKGYYAFSMEWLQNIHEDAGFSSKWIIRNGIAPRVFTLEIPGRASLEVKDALIGSIVPFLVQSFCTQ